MAFSKVFPSLLTFGILLAPPSVSPASDNQTKGILRGKIIDAGTKEPLSGVQVLLPGLNLKTRTSPSGEYALLDIPAGRYTAEFSLAGFKTNVQKDIVVSSEAATDLPVELDPDIPRLAEDVTVVAEALSSLNADFGSTASFSAEEAARVPGSVGDVSRVLSIVPGISHINEVSNDLIVRGGSPWENGYYIDNIQVPDINHFQRQGGSGGLISVIDVSFVKDMDFYTGGFAAAYGNRMSSIVDIKFREGRRDRFRGRMDLSSLGLGGRIEGPLFKKKGSLILSARRNYHDIVAKAIGIGIAPRFGDVHLKLSYDLNPKNKLTVLAINGNSRLSYDLAKALGEGLYNYGNYKAGQNTFGIDWLRSWGGLAYSDTSLSYSYFKSTCTLFHQGSASEYYVTDESLGEFNFRNVNHYQWSPQGRIEFGLELKSERGVFNNYFAEHRTRWGDLVPKCLSRGTYKSEKGAAFLSIIRSFREAWTLSLGARADYDSATKHFHLSPRLAASLKVHPRFSINGAFGLYPQELPWFLSAGNRTRPGLKNPVSTHYVLGFKYDLTKDTKCAVDFFLKKYRRLPLAAEDPGLSVIDSGVDYELNRFFEALSDEGQASCSGIELYIQKRAGGKFNYLLSASLFRSRYRDYSGVWRNRINDNRYLLTIMGGYNPDSSWQVSLRWTIAGGVPYSPFDAAESWRLNLGIIDRDQINAERYPPYHALNLRIDRQFRFKASELNVYLGVLNMYNRKNVERYYWDRIHNEPAASYQVPWLPMLGLEYTF